MNKIYKCKDCNINLIKDKSIGVIGYGIQGRAQALNLRDSGCSVIIGNNEDEYKTQAQKDGFIVKDILSVIKESDIIFLLIPDESHKNIFNKFITPFSKKDQLYIVAHGYSLKYKKYSYPSHINIGMIAPRAPGEPIRTSYLNNEGVPCFVDAIYDTYMVYYGSEIPSVLQAMIDQAKAGNVQAGRLVLEHSGKLIKNVNITIDSPLDKFLKADASPVEYVDAEIQDIVDDMPNIQDDVDRVIPKQTETHKEQKDREVKDIKKEIGMHKRSVARKKMYKLRKRAEAVGLEPLGKKPSALEKENWLKEIERRENDISGKE